MKKIITISILTVFGAGFTYSSECKLCPANKLNMCENKNERQLYKAMDEDEIDFHPLVFVYIPFK